MHAVLYVCLPRSAARTSLQARKRVTEYLLEENFADLRRFSGHCDYFSVGGRWSGQLTLLRLRDADPRAFARFWKGYTRPTGTEAEAEALFRKCFPDFAGKLPIHRSQVPDLGATDDAQMMDEVLFRQLRPGFTDGINYAYEIDKPNVICTEDDCDFEWPRTPEEAAKYWVVVIDYHF